MAAKWILRYHDFEDDFALAQKVRRVVYHVTQYFLKVVIVNHFVLN